MADYPTPSDYQEALQTPDAAFADSELQGATPRTNVLGLPQPITGAFAAVFPVTTDGGAQYAVKCFVKERPEQQERYDAVADHLATIDLDALLEFDYQPEGIRVGDERYPVLKMEWADGTGLNRFVEDHLDTPETISRLAEAWARLMKTLEARSVAHGDLQHGNVLVQRKEGSLQLRLVDYDTMYVPALDGWRSAEVGHRNYQHPDRTDTDFGLFLDRFPGLAVFTALQACAVRPSLWDRYDTGENLLFRDADFYAPDQSPLFEELATIESLRELVRALRTACYVEPADVPPLADVRAGRVEPAGASVSQSRRRRARGTDGERGVFAKAFLPGAIGAGLGAVGVWLLGAPWMALGVLLVAAIGGLGEAGRRYRQLSVVRRRRRLEQEAAHFTDAIQALERERESLRDKRAEMLDSIEERREDRLRELQEEVLYDHLKHHFIGEVREVDGLIHRHVVRLKAANIRTAYEATPEAVASVQRISDEARARIRQWRAALVQKYEDEIPEELTPAEERRLRRYIEHRIENIDEQLARTQEKIQVQETERDRIRERIDQMPSMSFMRYLRYLCRLDSLPDPRGRPPAPKGRSTRSKGDQNKESNTSSLPPLLDDRKPWWKRG